MSSEDEISPSDRTVKVTISGRDIELTPLSGGMPGTTWEVTVWQASSAYVRHKMGGAFAHPERGFGMTPADAIACLFEKLDDAGEMEGQYDPCESCGKGMRILSVVTSYIKHDDKCPAMNEGNNEGPRETG
jgi:hypothetical protein